MHHIDIHKNGLVETELPLLAQRHQLLRDLKLALDARAMNRRILLDRLHRTRDKRVENEVLQELVQAHLQPERRQRLRLVRAHLVRRLPDHLLHRPENARDIAVVGLTHENLEHALLIVVAAPHRILSLATQAVLEQVLVVPLLIELLDAHRMHRVLEGKDTRHVVPLSQRWVIW